VGDSVDVHCPRKRIFIKNASKSLKIQCRMEEGAPQWREYNTGDPPEYCQPGYQRIFER